MNKLVNLLIIVFAIIISAESHAQIFGVKAGLNLSNMLVKDDDGTYSDDYKLNPGFHAGVTAEFPVTELFSFDTGLLLSRKGFKIDAESGSLSIKSSLSPLYLDIPLTGKASYNLGNAKVYGAFGPYLGVGIGGKIKMKITYEGETEKDDENIEWGSDEDEDDDLKRLDYGITIGGGIEINSVRVGLMYNYGLANISSYTDDGATMSNRVLGISVGYRFGGS